MDATNTKVTVALGAQVTCTIVNTDNTPQLKLVKDVQNNDGGTATAADYNLSAAASGESLGRNFSSQTATPTFHNVSGGSQYTLTESPNPGTGYSSTGIWSCDGGTFTGPNKITVPLGGSVTCTIVNTDNTPQLKLVKDVQNNDGGTVDGCGLQPVRGSQRQSAWAATSARRLRPRPSTTSRAVRSTR